ncbi:hypothetical protein K438DRAFT_1585844 [Mycena galopus ATCC 62051]|nr:hypothetical protein K438DRAFT_1585844 [Mycena galopus ATCC 62051]
MFTSIVFTSVLASSAVLLSQAIVTPNEPGPGESFDEGAQCHIAWDGDATSTTAWKNMAIQLMTGPNEAMVPVTTVATGQDGTVAGTFDYTCPQVTPNSAIYFYQFVSGGTPNITWTTRFTIAAADGSSTNATLSEKASDGTTVFYGTGALVDPSTAVPPPTFDATNTTTTSSSGTTGSGSNSASASAPSAPSNPSGTASTPSGTSGTSKSSAVPSSPAKSNSAANSSAPSPSQSGSSAVAVGPIDTRIWPFVAALTACAMTFTILL